ncbi:MAG: hypothetical protein JNK14_14085 [Chitinophagaceae bacterium]|nr:hypothetical protein [Chitinophagaceae bacterium]
MTPELKKACEVIFQEHKTISQLKWERHSFHGRLSIGLCEMAKQTLVRKNILLLPDKSKKMITLLNPAVVAAANVEEAEEMIIHKKVIAPSIVTGDVHTVMIKDEHPAFYIPVTENADSLLINGNMLTTNTAATKWYMRPVFYYIIWPICALVTGALIAYLLGVAYTELFPAIK